MDYVVADEVYKPILRSTSSSISTPSAELGRDGQLGPQRRPGLRDRQGEGPPRRRARAPSGGPARPFALSPGPARSSARTRASATSRVEFWLYPGQRRQRRSRSCSGSSLRKLPVGRPAPAALLRRVGRQARLVLRGLLSPPGRGQGRGRRLEARAPGPGASRAAGLVPPPPALRRRHRPPRVPRRRAARGRGLRHGPGREGGTVFEPAVGAAAPLEILPRVLGARRRAQDSPPLRRRARARGRSAATLARRTPVADFGYGNSRLMAVEAEYKAPGNASVEFAYRIADSWAAWRPDYAGLDSAPARARPCPSRRGAGTSRSGPSSTPTARGASRPRSPRSRSAIEPDPPPPAPGRLDRLSQGRRRRAALDQGSRGRPRGLPRILR